MATELQIQANRANAQLSTGPSSPEGKLKSSHNALKTGLTGRTILLPSDDVAAYESFVALLQRKLQPADDYQKHLVQTIADTEWRLLRIPTLEAGYYALGRHELAAECAHETDPQARASLLDALIHRTYKKDFNSLALQERRLRTQLAKLVAELEALQALADEVQFQRRNLYMTRPGWLKHQPSPNDAEHFGFEFTDEYLKTRSTASRGGGEAALRLFDRSWRAQMAKKSA